MQNVTILIAITATFVVFLVRPATTLIIYFAVLIWYPTYLTVQLGTLDFSVSRILILAIFIRILLTEGTSFSFKPLLMDKFVLAYFGLSLMAGLTTTESGRMIEYWSGGFVDMVLPYFATRLLIKTKNDYLMLLKGILALSIPFAILSIYQCIAGNNPFGFLEFYNAFREHPAGYTPQGRAGFYRANLTFGVSIMLGMYFATVCGCCAGLFNYFKQKKILFYSSVGLIGIGAISSMSSGPILMAMVLTTVLAVFKYRQYWRSLACLLVAMLILVEIGSNSPWYMALSRFTFSPATAYYRTLLIRTAFGGGMAEHWLTGYGLADPGWGARIFSQEWTDLVNHYILILVGYGLVGLIPFLCILSCAFQRLRKAFINSTDEAERWLVWTLMSVLVALLVVFMSVSLFAQTRTVFFIVLAFCASIPIWVGSEITYSPTTRYAKIYQCVP